MGDLSEHFSKKEFACKCGCGFDKVSQTLIDFLEVIRAHYGVPVTINSGCRCRKHNAKEKGGKASRHLPNPKTGLCDAADIEVKGHPAKEVAAWIYERYPNVGGVGLYKAAPDMVHVDTRGGKARWTH